MVNVFRNDEYDRYPPIRRIFFMRRIIYLKKVDKGICLEEYLNIKYNKNTI
jgi:oxalate decarboxylase/phosphoglucose isomerase-like protein (cupin superfamily)